MGNARYLLFRQLMDLLSDEYEIVKATTHDYLGEIRIEAADKESGIILILGVAIEGEDGGKDG